MRRMKARPCIPVVVGVGVGECAGGEVVVWWCVGVFEFVVFFLGGVRHEIRKEGQAPIQGGYGIGWRSPFGAPAFGGAEDIAHIR